MIPTRCLRGEKIEGFEEFDVASLFQKLVLKENERPWTRKVNCYHPSAMSGCKRAIYYDRIGTEPKACWDLQTLMYFHLGHALHDMVQDKLLAEVPGFQSEITVDFPALNIYGHTDGVFAEEDWLLEIKTMGSSSFNSLIRPKKEHVEQVHCYMAGTDIPRAQILYVNRDNGLTRGFKVYFDEEIWQGVVATIAEVEEHVKSEEPPAREVSRWTCRTCKFKWECKPEF